MIDNSRNGKISGESISEGCGLHIDDSNNSTLKGFRIAGGQKGIVLEGLNKSLLDDLLITGTGQEAIHVLTYS